MTKEYIFGFSFALISSCLINLVVYSWAIKDYRKIDIESHKKFKKEMCIFYIILLIGFLTHCNYVFILLIPIFIIVLINIIKGSDSKCDLIYFLPILLLLLWIIISFIMKFQIKIYIAIVIFVIILTNICILRSKIISIIEYLLFHFSMDSIFSTLIKCAIEKQEISNSKKSNIRKKVVSMKNKFNFSCTLLLLVVLLLTKISSNTNCLNILYYFLIFRLLSRSVEIIIAFYKDVIDEKDINKTGLKDSERMMLAITSLFEIIIICAVLYTLNGVINCDEAINLYTLQINIMKSVINTITFCSGALNQSRLYSAIIVMQGLTSFVLIVFTFAGYMTGSKKEKNLNSKYKNRRTKK